VIYAGIAVIHEYDPSSNALYMRIRPGKVFQTLEVGEGVFIDIDSKGWTLGVEVISPAPELLQKLIRLAEENHAPPMIRFTG
jgi:uncharacterized protein YuzE